MTVLWIWCVCVCVCENLRVFYFFLRWFFSREKLLYYFWEGGGGKGEGRRDEEFEIKICWNEQLTKGFKFFLVFFFSRRLAENIGIQFMALKLHFLFLFLFIFSFFAILFLLRFIFADGSNRIEGKEKRQQIYMHSCWKSNFFCRRCCFIFISIFTSLVLQNVPFFVVVS